MALPRTTPFDRLQVEEVSIEEPRSESLQLIWSARRTQEACRQQVLFVKETEPWPARTSDINFDKSSQLAVSETIEEVIMSQAASGQLNEYFLEATKQFLFSQKRLDSRSRKCGRCFAHGFLVESHEECPFFFCDCTPCREYTDRSARFRLVFPDRSPRFAGEKWLVSSSNRIYPQSQKAAVDLIRTINADNEPTFKQVADVAKLIGAVFYIRIYNTPYVVWSDPTTYILSQVDADKRDRIPRLVFEGLNKDVSAVIGSLFKYYATGYLTCYGVRPPNGPHLKIVAVEIHRKDPDRSKLEHVHCDFDTQIRSPIGDFVARPCFALLSYFDRLEYLPFDTSAYSDEDGLFQVMINQCSFKGIVRKADFRDSQLKTMRKLNFNRWFLLVVANLALIPPQTGIPGIAEGQDVSHVIRISDDITKSVMQMMMRMRELDTTIIRDDFVNTGISEAAALDMYFTTAVALMQIRTKNPTAYNALRSDAAKLFNLPEECLMEGGVLNELRILAATHRRTETGFAYLNDDNQRAVITALGQVRCAPYKLQEVFPRVMGQKLTEQIMNGISGIDESVKKTVSRIFQNIPNILVPRQVSMSPSMSPNKGHEVKTTPKMKIRLTAKAQRFVEQSVGKAPAMRKDPRIERREAEMASQKEPVEQVQEQESAEQIQDEEPDEQVQNKEPPKTIQEKEPNRRSEQLAKKQKVEIGVGTDDGIGSEDQEFPSVIDQVKPGPTGSVVPNTNAPRGRGRGRLSVIMGNIKTG